MQSVPANLRPLDMGDLLDAIFRLYRNNFLTFVGSVALLLVPFAIIQAVLSWQFQQSILANFPSPASPPAPGANPFDMMPFDLNSLSWIMLLSLVQMFIVFPIMYGGIIWVSKQRLNDQPVSIIGAYSYGARRILGVMGVSLLFGLLGLLIFGVPYVLLILAAVGAFTASLSSMASGGAESAESMVNTLLMFIPLVIVWLIGGLILMMWLGTRLVFAFQMVVIQGHDPITAFKRSWSLTRGSFWRVLGLFLLVLLLIFVLSVVVSLVLQSINTAVLFGSGAVWAGDMSIFPIMQAINTLFGYLMNVLFYPVYGIFSTLLYYDLLVRKEGSDLEQMMGEAMTLPEPQA
jgi:hypothetical protein